MSHIYSVDKEVEWSMRSAVREQKSAMLEK